MWGVRVFQSHWLLPGGSGQDSCSASQMSRGSHSLLPISGQLGEPWELHLRGLGLRPPPTPLGR